MARGQCGYSVRSITLLMVAACAALTTPAFARDADDAFVAMPLQMQIIDGLSLVRPLPRPDLDATPAVSRTAAAAPAVLIAPEPRDISRIRQSWAIGVFR